MRTAFFGGTFDPVHTGHICLARKVLDAGAAEKILFVPAPSPPHKDDTLITPYKYRLEMLQLALNGEDGFEVSDIEQHRCGKSYTIDTLHELSAMQCYGEIFLLIGGDSLRNLHTWRQAHELVSEFGLIIYPRREEEIREKELAQHWNQEEIRKILASLLPDAPEFPCSSTQIRKMIQKEGIKSVSAFVRSPVAEYITARKLYL